MFSNSNASIRGAEIGQFRLQVDRQTKATFSTYEAAEEAGREIKKGTCGSGGSIRYRRVLILNYRAPRDVISTAQPVFNPPCEPVIGTPHHHQSLFRLLSNTCSLA
jgi:hypothetical protein